MRKGKDLNKRLRQLIDMDKYNIQDKWMYRTGYIPPLPYTMLKNTPQIPREKGTWEQYREKFNHLFGSNL